MSALFFCLAILPFLVKGQPYVPGHPGGAWTSEEVDIVRRKVLELLNQKNYNWKHPKGVFVQEGTFSEWQAGKSRRPMTSRLVRLAFHDCLKNIDENGQKVGGCDGCLNWEGMGTEYDEGWLPPIDVNSYPIKYRTDNNGLSQTVRALEMIYTNRSWPSTAPSLPESLKHSGKSRADLWQFAANVALEIEIERANFGCDFDFNRKQQTRLLEGESECFLKLHKPITFQTGRVDCVPDPELKVTEFDYEGTRQESHSNPWGTGDQVLRDLKEDFNLTARESIALMATHSIAPQDHNKKMVTKYRWIGAPYLSNMYYKYLAKSAVYERGDGLGFDPSYAFHSVGNKYGGPVAGSEWRFHCHGIWNTSEHNGGPCHFRPTKGWCKELNDNQEYRWSDCFKGFNDNGKVIVSNATHCNGTWFDQNRKQHGGEKHAAHDNRCNHEWTFAFNYEYSFMYNITVDSENRARGCANLDIPLEELLAKPMTEQVVHCDKNEYSPEGEATSAIIQDFADHHDSWAVHFLQGWHKMQANGYQADQLTDGPQYSWLGYSFLNPEDYDKLEFPLVFTNNSLADPTLETDSMITFREFCTDAGPGSCPPDLFV